MKKGKTAEQFAAPEAEALPLPGLTPRMAAQGALALLSNEERMILTYLFLDGRTPSPKSPACLGVHESTISRKVDKLAKSLRKKILANMIQQGMARRQAEEALEVDCATCG